MSRRYAAIIVGAGAAGLAAAEVLAQRNEDFLLIEARSRVGGRVHSLIEDGYPVPVELGAEFIHGVPDSLMNKLASSQIHFYDVQDNHLFLRRGKLKEIDDFWSRMESVMRKIPKHGKDNRSVHEFIHSQRSVDKETRDLFLAFVEGFHNADPRVIGERALLETQETDDSHLNGSMAFRTVQRYDSFLQKIAARVEAQDRLRLSTELKRVDWSRGEVKLTCSHGASKEPVTYSCSKVLITLPIGVLQSKSIEWEPRPRELDQALEAQRIGHVQKIIFRFRERFWENLRQDEPVTYLHTGADEYFPTWWSYQPLRTPHLIAWQGGPKAQELAGWPEEERVAAALKTLSKLTGRKTSFISAQVQSHFTHCWSNDPFTRGAYSYVATGGLNAAKKLNRPIEGTLFFAGEAHAPGPKRATVHGAFESGLAAVSPKSGFLPLT